LGGPVKKHSTQCLLKLLQLHGKRGLGHAAAGGGLAKMPFSGYGVHVAQLLEGHSIVFIYDKYTIIDFYDG
jgi:hypothetical protein